MAVVYRTEQLGKTVSAYSPCHEMRASYQSDGLSDRGLRSEPYGHASVAECVGALESEVTLLRNHLSQRGRRPPVISRMYLDRHIPGPPAFLGSVSVALWCPGD